MKTLTHERLKELLSYNPETGVFRWKIRVGGKSVGERAGYVKTDGYRCIGIDGSYYAEGRLAWFFINGRWPKKEIDHRDRNRSNNIYNNLREASRSQNMANVLPKSSSGIKGVHFHRRTGKYQAKMRKNGVLFYLGLFETKEQAMTAYAKAAVVAHGEFVRV